MRREAEIVREKGHDANNKTKRTHSGDHRGWKRPWSGTRTQIFCKGLPGLRYSSQKMKLPSSKTNQLVVEKLPLITDITKEEQVNNWKEQVGKLLNGDGLDP